MTHIGSYAQVILPGVSFAEKDGTFTNMERRVQRVRKAISPIGDSMPDWKILCDLSTKMGYPMDIRALLRLWRRSPLWYPSMPESVIPISRRAESNGLPRMDGRRDSHLLNIKGQQSNLIPNILYGSFQEVFISITESGPRPREPWG